MLKRSSEKRRRGDERRASVDPQAFAAPHVAVDADANPREALPAAVLGAPAVELPAPPSTPLLFLLSSVLISAEELRALKVVVKLPEDESAWLFPQPPPAADALASTGGGDACARRLRFPPPPRSLCTAVDAAYYVHRAAAVAIELDMIALLQSEARAPSTRRPEPAPTDAASASACGRCLSTAAPTHAEAADAALWAQAHGGAGGGAAPARNDHYAGRASAGGFAVYEDGGVARGSASAAARALPTPYGAPQLAPPDLPQPAGLSPRRQPPLGARTASAPIVIDCTSSPESARRSPRGEAAAFAGGAMPGAARAAAALASAAMAAGAQCRAGQGGPAHEGHDRAPLRAACAPLAPSTAHAPRPAPAVAIAPPPSRVATAGRAAPAPKAQQAAAAGAKRPAPGAMPQAAPGQRRCECYFNSNATPAHAVQSARSAAALPAARAPAPLPQPQQQRHPSFLPPREPAVPVHPPPAPAPSVNRPPAPAPLQQQPRLQQWPQQQPQPRPQQWPQQQPQPWPHPQPWQQPQPRQAPQPQRAPAVLPVAPSPQGARCHVCGQQPPPGAPAGWLEQHAALCICDGFDDGMCKDFFDLSDVA
jgi:hypothetical protein